MKWLASESAPFPAYTGTWTPLELYLNGAALAVWGDIVWAPRLTAFLFSVMLLVFFYLLVQRLFSNSRIALGGSLLLLTNDWYSWLSGTPALDIYSLSCLVGAIFLVVKWVGDGTFFSLYASAAFLFLCSGFHIANWVVVASLPPIVFWLLPAERRKKAKGRFLFFTFLSYLFPLAYIALDYTHTGEWLHFLSSHAEAARIFYQGHQVGRLEKLTYYTKLVWHSAHFFWFLVPPALLSLRRQRVRPIIYLPLCLGVVNLTVYSLARLASGPASAAPGRYSLLYFLMFSPYLVYGIYLPLKATGLHPRVRLIVSGGLFCLFVAMNLSGTIKGRGVTPPQAFKTGVQVRQADQNWNVGETLVIEQTIDYQDMAVRMTANQENRVRGDRDDRNGESWLRGNDHQVIERLESENARLVVVRQELAAHLESKPFLRKLDTFEPWTIFEVRSISGR